MYYNGYKTTNYVAVHAGGVLAVSDTADDPGNGMFGENSFTDFGLVAWVHEMGGTVEFTAKRRGPEWLRKRLGRDFFDDVTGVGFKNTQVSDVSPLAELTELEYLDFVGTQVSDLSPLAKLAKLEVLYLHNTQVSDVSPLAKLTKLEYLDLSNTQVSDVTPLAKLTNLKLLSLDNTRVSEQAIEQLKRALPQCVIND